MIGQIVNWIDFKINWILMIIQIKILHNLQTVNICFFSLSV